VGQAGDRAASSGRFGSAANRVPIPHERGAEHRRDAWLGAAVGARVSLHHFTEHRES
jgi:hypothetical protein